MKIQSISAISSYNQRFTAQKKRKKNVDRAVTLQDLYEMEDRIKKQNADLFAKQNNLIGKTLDSIIRIAYLSPSETNGGDVDDEFDSGCNNARILINNGHNKNN